MSERVLTLTAQLAQLLALEFEALKSQDLDRFESLQPGKNDLLQELTEKCPPAQDLQDLPEWENLREMLIECRDLHRRNAILIERKLDTIRATVKLHVGLTHAHPNVLRAADTLARLLYRISEGVTVRDAIRQEAGDWLSGKQADSWLHQDDCHVVGQRFSSACYIAEAMPASLYLAWKYHDDFSAGVIANAMCGGDNCHRGAVVGSLLAAANGIESTWQRFPSA